MDHEEEHYERQLSDKVIFRRLLGFALPFKNYFIFGVLILLINIPIALYNPILKSKIINILASEDINFDKILFNVILMIVILVINATCTYLMFYLLQKAGQKINCHVREELFTHIESFSNNQFNLTPVGKFVTRVANDVNNITDLYTNIIIGYLRNGFTVIIALTYMFILNWKLTLIAIASFPLLVIATIIFRYFSRKYYRQSRTYNTEVNSFLSEHLSGVKITQIFGREDLEYQKFAFKTNRLKKSYLKSITSFAIFRPFIHFLYIVAIALAFYFGGIDVINEALIIGTLFAFYEYIDQFYSPLQQIAEQFDTLQSAFASAEKIFFILDTKPEIVDGPDAVELENFKGEIEFKDVWFSYKKDEWILKGISFKINANDTVAFVGETGSGKTTILSLITRNYDIQKGEILIDGINVQQIKLDSLRGSISQMLQDVFLFSGTIESNIKLRENERFSEEEMLSAAKYVNADKFVSKLPNKYAEPVLERGNNFSAGERQLLSFARAILHQPKILILDEATANIDTETEQLIQNSLEKMMNIGTMLIVAHRLSTIQNSNKIIVLDKGEILESGTHKELLQKKGHYYNLYLLQFANDSKA